MLSPTASRIIKSALLYHSLRGYAIKYSSSQMARGFKRPDAFVPPEAVMRDKRDLVVAMLTSIDRGLSRGLISRDYWSRFFDAFALMFVRGYPKVKEFRERHGIEPPGFVTISPTHFCNLKCDGCYSTSSSAQRERLDYEVFSRIIREQKELWGSHFTVISGGEPFVYRDAGKRLTDIFREHRDSFFQIYTNGMLITEEVARELAECANATPAISVEGFEKETDDRRGRGVHRKILRAMENLRKAQVPFGISVTATRKNINLLLEDKFWDYWFEEEGALYAWLFQYMPIGRAYTLELMITPEERLRSFEMTWREIREKKRFIADFWNCGTASNGCISAGVRGGYMHIDWNGAVCPCVFVPYFQDNIKDVFARGGCLNEVLFSPLFVGIRQWQRDYVYDREPWEMGNVIATCPYRDHYDFMHSLLTDTCAKPEDKEARVALADEEYRKRLIDYGRRFQAETEGIWRTRYLGSCKPASIGEVSHSDDECASWFATRAGALRDCVSRLSSLFFN